MRPVCVSSCGSLKTTLAEVNFCSVFGGEGGGGAKGAWAVTPGFHVSRREAELCWLGEEEMVTFVVLT